MTVTFRPDDEYAVLHRMNFWGRPGYNNALGHTASWEYRNGVGWSVPRPADGEAPRRVEVTCAVCKKSLVYRVHSAADSERRRRNYGWFALAGLLLIPAGIVLVTVGANEVDAGNDDWTAAAIAGVLVVVLGIVIAQSFNLVREGFVGVTGSGEPSPGFAKHEVNGTRKTPYPNPTCQKCGHEEPYPCGLGFTDEQVEARYAQAVAQLERHVHNAHVRVVRHELRRRGRF
ncbi:hypothetical protein GCM10027059_02750 [Myceligenerans halotolerans]